ncbi:MAG: COX15/CtaA family protein [Proteobacteria bacterium]|nr:COX15/CtaA family protein [Pseudomonadota bacterium]
MITAYKPISCWLFSCAAAVFMMALIGAITRLTESGLSITEWKPVMGALPPLNDTAWAHEFSLYQATPQYKDINLGMSLESFKQIYFWEWLHRLFGRLIGVIYFIPLVRFWIKKQIPSEAKKTLLGILALGFLQGAMGWYMVKSGLVDQPAVSHYRLAAHLGLAFIIFCSLLYMGLAFCTSRDPAAEKLVPLRKLVAGTLALAGITMMWGALVAGLRAGLIYNNDFPFMGKYVWPTEMFRFSPPWTNFFENHAAVQFTHRILALLTFITILFVVWKSSTVECPPRLRKLFSALLIMTCVQVGLGITTLVTHVNIVVANLHQAGALTILAILTALLYNLPKKA